MCYHIQIMHDEEQTQDPVHARQAFYQIKCIPEFNTVFISIPLMDTEVGHVLGMGQLYYIFNVVPIKIPMIFFKKAEENPKIHMETCKIPQLVKSNPKQKDLDQQHDKTLDP